MKSLSGWKDDWIVIADEGADPFIFSRESGSVLYALHGQGVWEPDEFVSDVVIFAGTVAALGVIVADARPDFTNADCYVKPAYIQQAKIDLRPFVESQNDVEAFLAVMGWAIP